MKIRVRCGFRYDVEAVVDAEEGWEERFVHEKEIMPVELKKSLDSDFGAEGVVSDLEIQCRVEEEEK